MRPDNTIGSTHLGVHKMNVTRFPGARAPREYASLQAKVESYQAVPRDWAGHLTGNEMTMVGVLLDRTVGWGRREAYFTIRALLDGDAKYSGLKMSRSTAFRVLKSLEDRGLIKRRKDASVPDRVHFTVNLEWRRATVVAFPARSEGQCQSDTNQCHDDINQCHSDTLSTGINLRVSQTGNQARPPATLPLSEIMEVRGSKSGPTAVRVQDEAHVRAAPQANLDAVEEAWRDALVDTFPGTAYRSWTVRQKAQVKTVLRTWRGDCTFPQFVTWALNNWTAIIRKQFKWMTKVPPPTVPTLSFFIAFIDQFSDARADNVLEDWLSNEDRTEIERMMGRGQTYEQATAKLGRSKAQVAMRDEMTKREIEARANNNAATRKLAEARKIAELDGRIPIHPNSPLAKEMKAAELKARAARPQPTKVIAPDGEVYRDAEVYFVDPDRNPFDE